MDNQKSYSCLILILIILTVFMGGCTHEDKSSPAISVSTSPLVEDSTAMPTISDEESDIIGNTTKPSPEATEPAVPQMTEIQRNSISMLNYLAGMTQEINSSKNSRVYLERAYSVLLNNTHPNAVDEKTQDQLIFLLDTLKNYRMITVKRDRLQFIYEQNQAQAMRDAVPNPLILLSTVNSFDWKKMAVAVVYMAVDSYSNYKSSKALADIQFIQDGWELDDEEQEVLHNINVETFAYLNNTVRELGLKGDDALLALNDDAIATFVDWKNNNNVAQRIRFLESNQKKYKAYGDYWLVLAESYYSHGDYEKCLNALASYESLDIHIFRDDSGYAKILPLAIISANEACSENEYIDKATHYANAIIENTDDNYEWALRYFAAQTYIDLFAKTQDDSYLQKAYNIALDNVNWLCGEQKAQNNTYLHDVVEQTVPKDATEAEKTEIDNYNRQIKEDRKLALPPIYEPFLLNCELLFSLSDKLGISEKDRENIDEILHENESIIFLNPTLDSRYSFNNALKASDYSSIDIFFNGKELRIPAIYVSNYSVIRVTVSSDSTNEPTIFEDWTVTSVDRKNKDDINSFIASFTSNSASQFQYKLDSTISIEIIAHEGSSAEKLVINYITVNTKTDFFKNIAFWNSNIGFKRVS